jgi:cytochrome c-type biogenesis protein CcmH/NrfG
VSNQSSSSKVQHSKNNNLVILVLGFIVVVSALSFGIRRYTIEQDKKIGEKKIAEQAQQQAQSNPHSENEMDILKRAAQSVGMLRDSLKKNPTDTSLIFPLASALVAARDTAGAIEQYKRYVTQVAPENIAAKSDYAYLLFETGKKSEGFALMKNVLKTDPKNQIALYNMGVMFYKERNFEQAIRYMSDVVLADSSSQLGVQAKMAVTDLKSMKSESK